MVATNSGVRKMKFIFSKTIEKYFVKSGMKYEIRQS